MKRKILVLVLSVVLIVSAFGLIRWLRQPHLEEVRFNSGELTLAGTLYTPAQAGPHPVVIFIHGSGDDSREQYRFYADLLARKGIAVLIYDKRGVGDSGGNWKTSPFSVLADDALAGIHFLKSQAAIDGSRIGAWGGSEGAIIAPWIASRSADVRFVIMQSAVGVTFAEQNVYQNERLIRAVTNAEEDVAQGLATVTLMHDYARTGTGWQAYADAKDAIRQKPWASALGGTIASDNWWWRWYRTKMDYDPIPMLEQVRVPVLAVWGDNDVLVPVAKSRAAIAQAFTRAGNRDVTFQVFARADHSLQTESWLHGRRPDPDYIDLLTDWILKHTQAQK